VDNQLLYKIAISFIPKIGPVNAKKLIAYVGSLEGVFKEKKRILVKIPGIGETLAKIIIKNNVIEEAKREIEFINKYNLKTYFFLDKDYPNRLKECYDSPILLYMKGDVDLNNSKIISIIGTRKATDYGKSICDKLITDINARGHNPVIVSGLAYGIDVQAHKSALNNNFKTIAVLGHGLNLIYPVAHSSVAKDIIKNGGLLTEFKSNSKNDKGNFVRRNRIIAGMSDATIVVESAKKGGALITADIANSYNRDVFAFPGNINNKYSEGCNRLIKSHKAALIESVADLEYILGWEQNKKPKAIQTKIFNELSTEEKTIVNLLKKDDKLNIDIIRIKTELSISKISALLLNLEFNGIVKSLPGKVYGLIK